MHYYIVTIAPRLEKYHSPESLDMEWAKIRRKLRGADWSDQVAYEIDSRERLHLHTIMKREKQVLNPFRYATKEHSIHMSPFPGEDYDTVLAYIKKHAYNRYEQEQILIQNYYNHHYGFL